jgi:peptidyl-prolyl cis-trans isomerase SurA
MKKIINILVIVFFIILSKSVALENKIILKIENEIITTVDIFKEINYLKFFSKELNQISEQEVYQIAVESITRNKIKKIEILKNFEDINLKNEDYLNSVINEKLKNLGFKDLKNFKEELIKKKIDFNDLKKKLMIDVLWSQIIYAKYNDKIVINVDELKNNLQKKQKYIKSINLKEIIFDVEDNNEIQVKYNLIKSDIEKIGFENTAIKYSTSITATNGGNLGWISERAINKKVLNELKNTPLKSITKPIRISSGFLILQKYDEKKIEENIDLELELKKLIDYEKNQQFNNYSNLYYNKVKKNLNINAP